MMVCRFDDSRLLLVLQTDHSRAAGLIGLPSLTLYTRGDSSEENYFSIHDPSQAGRRRLDLDSRLNQFFQSYKSALPRPAS